MLMSNDGRRSAAGVPALPAVPEHTPSVVPAGTRLRVFDNGEAVLRAEDITAAAQGEGRADKVAKLSPAVDRRGIPYDVVMATSENPHHAAGRSFFRLTLLLVLRGFSRNVKQASKRNERSE
jgi:hypothetical protein